MLITKQDTKIKEVTSQKIYIKDEVLKAVLSEVLNIEKWEVKNKKSGDYSETKKEFLETAILINSYVIKESFSQKELYDILGQKKFYMLNRLDF